MLNYKKAVMNYKLSLHNQCENTIKFNHIFITLVWHVYLQVSFEESFTCLQVMIICSLYHLKANFYDVPSPDFVYRSGVLFGDGILHSVYVFIGKQATQFL